jgi:NADPH:quinone reductase
MKTMAMMAFGDTHVFEALELPHPKIIPNHVLIKIMATSVNPFDCKLRKGVYRDLISGFPTILQGDIAGMITEVGEGVTDFAVGDEVYGCVGGILQLQGGLAEYTLADPRLIAHKPKTVSWRMAAALPLVSLTAWEALVTYANVKANRTVLIHGGTGGVGHIAIQLAKILDARVFATCGSAEKMAIAKQLGADEAINYRETSVASYVENLTAKKGFDVVFDTVGGEHLNSCFEAAALWGQVICISAAHQYDLTPAFLKGLSIHTVLQPLLLITGLHRARYGNILLQIAIWTDEGKIKPLVDNRLFTLPQVGAAHDYLEQGKAIGKVVLEGW